MQNRGAHISVQPGQAPRSNDESNPRGLVCYSATVFTAQSSEKVFQKSRKNVKPLAPPF